MEEKIEEKLKNKKWKYTNIKYLFELQKFLDLADNIEDEQMRKLLINQMLKVDKQLTTISEEMFENIKNMKNK